MAKKYQIKKQYTLWVAAAAAVTTIVVLSVDGILRGPSYFLLIELGVGLAVAAVFMAMSVLITQPVRWAFEELNNYVTRLERGETQTERFESELAEVDQVAQTLAIVVQRVAENQTKLTNAEHELKLAQKDLDEYTYAISHDLKEPLRGIDGFSKLLVEGYRNKLDDNGRYYVETIRNSTVRMQQLITDLLKFSRLSHQKQPLAPVGLNLMMMHVRLNLQFALDQKNAQLHVNHLPTVMCDATAITEVFHNLISNAVKYNDKTLPVVEINCTEKDNAKTHQTDYEFSIHDNGPGIKPENFEKVFQIFQRLHNDNTGTGLGLTIARRIVEWHGGRIWLESEEGKGTTFFFTLPKLAIGLSDPANPTTATP
ncbi:MAG: ATP-binding protein [Verrucomicrobiota bacterium]